MSSSSTEDQAPVAPEAVGAGSIAGVAAASTTAVARRAADPPAGLPWWTWLAPLVLCALGSLISMAFKFDTGFAILYLPTALGLAMIHWWGPRVLVGIYLSAIIMAPMWGVSWTLGPLVAVPETAGVFLAWLLFQRRYGLTPMLSDLRSMVGYICLGVAIPVAVISLSLQSLFVALKIEPASAFWFGVWRGWSVDVLGSLAVSVPLMAFATPWLRRGRRTLAIPDARVTPLLPPRLRRPLPAFLLAMAFLFMLVLSAFVTVVEYWFVYAVFIVTGALCFGAPIAIMTVSWTVLCTLLVPMVLAGHFGRLWLHHGELLDISLNLLVLSVVGLVTGRTISDSITEIEQRRAAEQSNRQAEERLRLMLRNTPAAVAMFDQQMRYLAHSRRWLTDYGIRDRDVVGRCHYDVVPETPSRWRDLFDRALGGAVERAVEDRFIRADGQTDWIRWEAHPWYDSPGRVGGIVVFSEVITLRKQAEDTLRESEQRFRAIAETTPLPAIVVRMQDWCLVYGNRDAATLLGMARDGMTGTDFRTLCAETGVAGRLMESLQRNAQVRAMEVQIKRVDGSLFWSSISVEPVTFRGEPALFMTLVDVTEWRDGMSLLRFERGVLDAVASACPVAMVCVESSGETRWFNEPARALLARDVPDDAGHSGSASIAVDALPWRQVIESGKPVARHRRDLRVVGGETRPVMVTAFPARDGAGRVIAAVISIEDATDQDAEARARDQAREEAQSEFGRLSEELVRQTRLTTIQQVVGQLTNELRGPLATIRNAGFYLRRRVPDMDPKWSEYLDSVQEQAQVIDRAIGNMAETSRPPAPVKQNVELTTLVKAAFGRVFNGEQVLCRCDFQPGLMVDADPSQLEQTLSSLFLNAIQAMRGRGQITVRAERGTRMDRILIQDDGPGVAPEFRTRIFEPLFSTRPSGAGLGLAIARRIVERHGGTLSLVDSRFGATFEILIPRETIKPDLAPQR